ncbi:sugar-binding protein [Halalkalibacterium halodurans]|uniref:sugar-binding protein n=1 Tax=Halalkalibacterium halodurans TaxID=86665 RepID=UPI002AA9EF38|nr:sugar-binding protein [Halalkalibacterium halodurans]MDY7224344.1 sugar-binding protein [Halalkalibacterium halodurans]MDY7243629.1 sugar-binding protein [Halalkalibacterium halodurans]
MKRHLFFVVGFMICISALATSIYSFVQVTRVETNVPSSTSISLPSSHFVLIAEEENNSYWRLVEKGAREAENQFDVLVEYKAPKRSNPEEQLKLIDMAISAKVDGIIVQAVNEEMFTPLINKAVDAGIPVVTIDTDAPRSNRVAYIGTDNYYSGTIAGKAMLDDIEGDIHVAIITGSLESSHQKLRVQGFIDMISKESRVTLVEVEASNISRLEAELKAHQLMEEHPHINAFYGTSALDGIGIVAAAEKLGLDDLYVIAFDTLPENLSLLEQEKIDAIVVQEPFEMGFKSVELLLDIREGQPYSMTNHTHTSIIRKPDLSLLQEHQRLGDKQ